MFYTIQGCLGGMNFSVPRGGREASPRLLMDNEDLVRAFSTVIQFTIFHESIVRKADWGYSDRGVISREVHFISRWRDQW